MPDTPENYALEWQSTIVVMSVKNKGPVSSLGICTISKSISWIVWGINNMTAEERRIEVMESAFEYADKSPCLKKKVGAALVTEDYEVVLSKGHGGWIHACERCVRKEYEWQQDGCWSIHAEMRCLFNYFEKYRRFSTDMTIFGYGRRGVMFTTHGPCDQCIKYMVYFGIPKMVYSVAYHNDYSKWKGLIEIYHLEGDGNLTREV